MENLKFYNVKGKAERNTFMSFNVEINVLCINVYKCDDIVCDNISTLNDMVTVQQCSEIDRSKYEHRKK